MVCGKNSAFPGPGRRHLCQAAWGREMLSMLPDLCVQRGSLCSALSRAVREGCESQRSPRGGGFRARSVEEGCAGCQGWLGPLEE